MRISGQWLDSDQTRDVCRSISAGGYAVWFVGGCVRNALLGRAVADIDLATDAHPGKIIELAENSGLRAIPTGIDHGTVTIVSGGIAYEVTTFRRDVESFGRRALVAYSDDIHEDAARRDFTMNALYADPTGKVFDPLGALPDLDAGVVRFVGDADRRIAEDFLRILRFFRFHAWYGDAEAGIDKTALAACAAGQDGLDGLSRERIGAEIAKLLNAPDPAPSVASMATTGILTRVLPGANPAALSPLVHLEQSAGLKPDWRRRVCSLGWRKQWADKLRLSRADHKVAQSITGALGEADKPAALAWKYGIDVARDAVLVSHAALGNPLPPDLEAQLAKGAEARFPVRAQDIGLEGADLGKALRRLQKIWVASDFSLSSEDLISRL